MVVGEQCSSDLRLKGNVLLINKEFSGLDSIKSRFAVLSFFQFSGNVQTVKVEFAKIDFLSRTAAHEVLLMQNSLSSKSLDISFLNIGTHVNEMLELVKKSLGKEKHAGLDLHNEQPYIQGFAAMVAEKLQEPATIIKMTKV